MEIDDKKLNLKKPLENFQNQDDFISLKKEKFLSLRKKKIERRNLYRIIYEKEIAEQEKYNIYEFEEKEFSKTKEFYEKKESNDIYKLPLQELIKKDYDDEEFKYWLYSMNKVSLKGKEEQIKKKILKNLTNEKINFLIRKLIDKSQFNINSDIPQLKNQIKFKYNICSLLINILYDTNKYNEVFISKLKDIIDFINLLIYYYENNKEISFAILITHYQWLINNGIQDHSIKKIINKNPTVNFPLLIYNVFNLNNSELYLNNIRMLVIYLSYQDDAKTFYQYNNFIQFIENIINYSAEKKDFNLLNSSFEALRILLKSEANCKLILESKQYIKLLSQIILGFNNISYCICCLSRLVKNDESNILNDNFQIYKSIIDIILNKTYSNKEIVKHGLKILRLIFNNKNGFNILNYILNNLGQPFFARLQELYFEKPHNLLIQSEIFNFYEDIFNCSHNDLKNKLLVNDLHIFTLDCLENSYEEFLNQNKDNDCYNKLIKKILHLLGTILKFGDNDLNIKISLKNCCEQKNIYHILNELNYCKNQDILDLVDYLNVNFFDGYENEEYDDYRDNADDD